MDELINRYLNEEFEYDGAVLEFPVSSLDIVLQKNESERGHIKAVSSDRDIKISGHARSSNLRLVIDNDMFDSEEWDIAYTVYTMGLPEGEVVKGEIRVESNKGEYYLPYSIRVKQPSFDSQLGAVKNMFHFANLAKENMSQAVNMFYSPDFKKILTGNDAKYMSMYRGLATDFGNKLNVEEFLVALRKKSHVKYIFSETDIVIKNNESAFQLKIGRSGWGYTAISVQADGDFINIEKRQLSDDDFLGQVCDFRFTIDESRLHRGHNFGKIKFLYDYRVQVVNVTVRAGAINRSIKMSATYKRQMCGITEMYANFRIGRLDKKDWIDLSETLLRQILINAENDPVARLLQAQILITRGREHEAARILEKIEEFISDGNRDLWIKCYMLYLQTLVYGESDYAAEVCDYVKSAYERFSDDWRIAWLLLYLEPIYEKSLGEKWNFLKNICENGCHSPVIYAEAINVLNINMDKFTKIGEFEQSVLMFAVRKGCLNETLARHTMYLIDHEKTYTKNLFYIAENCCELLKDTESLKTICGLLIKGGISSEESFKWYEAAIEERFPLNGLYETYMQAIPTGYDKPLPKAVMLYFMNDNTLDYRKKALMYRKILEEKSEDPDIANAYANQIEEFICREVFGGSITDDMAYLYENVFKDEKVAEGEVGVQLNDKMASSLSVLMFAYEIIVKDPQFLQVVVIHDKVKGEIRYPLYNGRAIISIYSRQHKIFLQDKNESRSADESFYTIRPYCGRRKLSALIAGYNTSTLRYDLYKCEVYSDYVVIDSSNAERFKRLLNSENVREYYKKEIRSKLFDYYNENRLFADLDECIENIDIDSLSPRQRGEVIGHMVDRGMYDVAFESISTYGIENIKPRIMALLAANMLIYDDVGYNSVLCAAAMCAFKNRQYNEDILLYLIKHFYGTFKEWEGICKTGIELGLNVERICYRMITRVLFTDSRISESMELYYLYRRMGGEQSVALAFLTYIAHDYFFRDKPVNETLFRAIFELKEESAELTRVCKLACLKYYAQNINKINEGFPYVLEFLREFLAEECYFSFFAAYARVDSRFNYAAERMAIEYKSVGDKNLLLHYLIDKGENEGSSYRKERMKKIYNGIYGSSFVVFYGEKIQYHITDEDSGELLTNGSVTMQNFSYEIWDREEGEERYALLNDMIIAKMHQDYETLQNVMEEYERKNYSAEQLFSLCEISSHGG